MLVFICPHMLKSLLSSNIFFSSISQQGNFVCGNHLSVVRPRPYPVLRPPLGELSQMFPSASNISILSLQTFSWWLLNHSHIISSWALIRERKCFLGFSHFSNAVTMASLGAHLKQKKTFWRHLQLFSCEGIERGAWEIFCWPSVVFSCSCCYCCCYCYCCFSSLADGHLVSLKLQRWLNRERWKKTSSVQPLPAY